MGSGDSRGSGDGCAAGVSSPSGDSAAFGDGLRSSVAPRGLSAGDRFPAAGEEVAACPPMSVAMLPTVRTSHARGCGGPANAAASSTTRAAAASVTKRPRTWRRGTPVGAAVAYRACDARGALNGAPADSSAASLAFSSSGRSRSGIAESTGFTRNHNAVGVRSRKLATPFRPEPAGELLAPLAQAGPDRALRHAFEPGDLAVVVAVHVPEHEVRRDPGRKRCERLHELGPGRGVCRVGPCARPAEPPQDLTDAPQLGAPAVGDRGVHRDLVDPRLCRLVRPETRPGGIGSRESFLDAVLRGARIPRDRVEDSEQPWVARPVEAIEIVAVSGLVRHAVPSAYAAWLPPRTDLD